LLLDDIFSELDSEKRKNVLKLCKDYQAIITSADEKDSLVKTGLLSHDINNLIQL